MGDVLHYGRCPTLWDMSYTIGDALMNVVLISSRPDKTCPDSYLVYTGSMVLIYYYRSRFLLILIRLS